MKEKIDQYLKLQDEIEGLGDKIFDYVYANFKELLEFGKYSSCEDITINKDSMVIKYLDRGYDLYEWNNLVVPMEHIINDTWKEFFQEKENERINKNIERLEQENVRKKENELKLLKELKEKYES